MVIKYPENVVKIAKILKDSGYKAYAVGGCVRDAIMGRVPNDWDITTSCSPERMLEIFDSAGIRTIPTGLKHGTVSVLLGGEIYECTTFRIDGSYTDSRHPDSVSFTSDVREDLRRRDFTVNAMAGDPLSEGIDIVDVFGGREDIENRIIRAVGDPETRFTEDALRILRALRFATVLDFDIEKSTLRAAISLGSRLSEVSAERKSVEIEKILLSKNADRGISLLIETELYKYIHPDIKAPKVSLSSLSSRFSTRLAALFDSIPDLSRMKLSGEITKQTVLLCNDELYREATEKFASKDATARLMISRFGDVAEDAALLRADTALANAIAEQREKSPCVSIKSLAINGNDLLSVGIEPKRLGAIMNALLFFVIESPENNSKERLIEKAIDMAR